MFCNYIVMKVTLKFISLYDVHVTSNQFYTLQFHYVIFLYIAIHTPVSLEILRLYVSGDVNWNTIALIIFIVSPVGHEQV